MRRERVQTPRQPANKGVATERLAAQALALGAVAAAAALRSETALWKALERALDAGASKEELEQAILEAAHAAQAAVKEDGLRTLREVLARADTMARWNVPADTEER